MVDVFQSSDMNQCIFVVTPNPAMGWDTQIALYVLISTVVLTIGILFFLIGFPLILPFSGLEILLLGYALYATTRQSQRQEVITIRDDLVVVEKGRKTPERSYEFNRQWVKVALVKSPTVSHPSRLMFQASGKQLEIGGFLNEEERKGLAKQLKNALL